MRFSRTLTIFLIALLGLSAASANLGVAFRDYQVEGIGGAPEPTIGIPWNTDSVFYLAGDITVRGVFDENHEVTWTDVTPLTAPPVNLDPMLIADEFTGRIFSGGLVGPCSIMNYSDDDGETWLPALNMCSGAQFDHQSIGVGPKPVVGNPMNLPQLNNGLYCGQLVLDGCSVSLDGGVTWTAPTPTAYSFLTDGCAGFHGHIRFSPVTGSAFLPVASCGDATGFVKADLAGVDGTEAVGLTGATFGSVVVPGSLPWLGGFDPSIGISKDNGWLYFGQADEHGAYMALTKDEGNSFENLPGADGAESTYVNVGQFFDPPVVKATFADVQAGDDDRVAYTFLGLEDLDGDGLGNEYPDIYGCEAPESGENREWHYFVAISHDAGQTWHTQKITDHPVQIGGIWDGGGGNPCRNLLDFNDMDIDSKGRIHIGYADGCVGDCLAEGGVRYNREGHLLRQTSGKTLFSAYDEDATVVDGGMTSDPGMGGNPGVSEDPESQDSPAGILLGAVALLGAALVARRRD